ncbi:hypothetical protein [uncultured Roseobacter sp.]|nr:hypothetical protein [uncultured Roseobacter sp.]
MIIAAQRRQQTPDADHNKARSTFALTQLDFHFCKARAFLLIFRGLCI